MSEGALIGLIFLGFFVLFPLLWVCISWLISHVSGWRNLARHYAIDQPGQVSKPRMRQQSVSMGYAPFSAARYSGVVNIGIDGIALYLSTIWLFRVGHKPLRIPFEDIEISDSQFLFLKMKRLVAKQSPNIKIYMRPGLVQKIEHFTVTAE